MTPRVLLLEHPWLPCMSLDGAQVDVGLRDCLVRAHEFRELVAETPIETVALHRLLLAVLHSALRGPRSPGEWTRWWSAGRFDADAIEPYLQRVRDRLFLFHPTHPFYQAPGSAGKAGSVARLMLQGDNNPTVFDHTTVDRPPVLTAARAARVLVASQAFDPGGTKTGDAGPAMAKAAPLCNSAVTMARGQSLFETLMLNMVRYDAANAEAPWSFVEAEDVPAWERAPVTGASTRIPAGYCDWLTWQSRCIRLIPDSDDDCPTVRQAVLMPGAAVHEAFVVKGREPALAFREAKSKTTTAWVPLRLDADRAIWRDSHTLLQGFTTTITPPVVRWLSTLVEDGALSAERECVLDVAGLAVDKAKPLFWRHERLRVPGALLKREPLRDALRQAMVLAEASAKVVAAEWVWLPSREKAVRSAVYVLALGLVRRDEDAPNVMAQWRTGERYWSLLHRHFDLFLLALPPSGLSEQDEASALQAAHERWKAATRDALSTTFAVVANGLSGAVAFQAIARAERELNWQVGQLLPVSVNGGAHGS